MPNERLSQDIATVKARQGIEMKVSKPQWQNVVDEATGMIFPAFFKTKDAIVESTCEKLRQLEKAAKNRSNDCSRTRQERIKSWRSE